MATNALLNIGSMGAAGATTRTRSDFTGGADSARAGGRQQEGEHSFDAAMQKATQAPKPRATGHEAKQHAAKDDVAGRGEDLPKEQVAKQEDGQASADSEGDNAATAPNTQAKRDDAGEDAGAVAAPVAQTDTGAVPPPKVDAGTPTPDPAISAQNASQGSEPPVMDTVSEPTLVAAPISAGNPVGPREGYAASAATDQDLSVAGQPSVSGKESNEGMQRLMSLLRPTGANETANGEQTKIAFNQLLNGSEQAIAASGARSEAGKVATSNVLNALTAPSGPLGPLGLTPSGPGSTTVAPTVTTPFGQPQWGENVGQQLQWMVSQNIQRADLKLNPAHLGPIEVRIVMHHDQVQVSMTASHAQVREALETAVPRLREGLESGGFGQASVDVGQQGFGEARAQGDNDPANLASASDNEESLEDAPVETLSGVRTAGTGLVDHYA